MYKILSDIAKINLKAWDDFVNHHPQGHFFQSPDAYHLFTAVKNYEPVVICCIDEKENVVGILLNVIQKEHNGIAGKFSSIQQITTGS